MIGAQAAKNPQPLLAALPLLPPECEIRFFGFDRSGVIADHCARHGDARVSHSGPLFGTALAAWYRDIDVLVSTEEHAGWANVVAEAMASGVPVVTTPAGTLPIAQHEETALVIAPATAAGTSQAIANSITRLHRDPRLRAKLSANARSRIEAFDWHGYSAALIDLILNFDGASHYLHAPELGLFGKATMGERLEGLHPLLERAKAIHSVLDVGAAEGVLAHHLLECGAGCVDAWEKDAERVALGQRLFGAMPGFALGTADLTTGAAWQDIHARVPVHGYDLVLYLGVHQHLPAPDGRHALDTLLALAQDWFAIRTPRENFMRDHIDDTIRAAGFNPAFAHQPDPASFAGPVHIYRRAPSYQPVQ